MPAVTTQGFQVQNMPNVQFADPASLIPQYSQILPSFSQGLSLAGQIQDAPILRQLNQIKLQREQAGLAAIPIEQKLHQIALVKAQQPIDSLDGVSVVNVPRAGGDQLQPMLDDLGQPVLDAQGNPRMENVAGSAPIDTMLQSRMKVFNPVTGAVTYEDRNTKVERTAEQLAADAALANYRGDMGEAAQRRATYAASKIAQGKKLSQGVNQQTGTLVVTIQNPDGSIEQVDTGQIPPPTLAQQIIGGIGQIGGATPPQNIAAPGQIAGPNDFRFKVPTAPALVPLKTAADTPATDAIDADTQALIDDLSKSLGAPAATYKSADDVKAAVRSGSLQKDAAIKILREQFGFK